MPSTRIANDVTREARRQSVRHQRSSPDDQIRRQLIFRPTGEQYWQPAWENTPQGSPVPVPSEIWFRLSERDSRNSAALPTTGWDFVTWLDSARGRWSDRKIEMYFLSFAPGTLKPEFFNWLRALADRNLHWPTRLLTDGRNITSTAVLDRILRSTLDEIQVYPAGLGEPAVSPRVLDAVKDLVDLRAARKQSHPRIVGRFCPAAGGSKLGTDLSLWAKQVGLDGFEVADKATEEQRLWGG